MHNLSGMLHVHMCTYVYMHMKRMGGGVVESDETVLQATPFSLEYKGDHRILGRFFSKFSVHTANPV